MEHRNVKQPVRLRRRTTKAGRQTLYLDYYIKGRRAYEYLNLYLEPGKENTEANRETLALAEAIHARRLLEIRNGTWEFPNREGEADLLEFMEALRCDKASREERWLNCMRHIRVYAGDGPVPFKRVSAGWVEGFRRYLDREAVVLSHKDYKDYVPKPLSLGTKGSYMAILKTALREAVKRGIIARNPAEHVKGFRGAEPRRVYLTWEEVQAMAGTECRYPLLRRAFLFSCLTGLRESDILKLTWAEVESGPGGGTRLVFRQQKTAGQEYLDIAPSAVELMGERGEPEARVFDGLVFYSKLNGVLREWAKAAGVDKHLTFHSGRHTFAVMMLDLGADIYTVQKLLGHRELTTTQMYADLLDKKKQAAVAKIPDLKI